MKYKKSIIIIMLTIFIFAIASASASDVNETARASGNTNQMELSGDEITDDNLQTNEENPSPALENNDEIVSASNELDVLSTNTGTYSMLASEIGSGGKIELKYGYYTYDNYGSSISIMDDNSVIDGKGAVIDMAGSNILAFDVSALDVTIKNLTIKNANSNNEGGAIYFSYSGSVINCNFTNSSAVNGGAIYFTKTGNVTNCNFAGNTANDDGGAVYFENSGNVTNCNFTDNTASSQGGAIRFSGLCTVTNCNFTDNTVTYDGGAVYFSSTGTVTNCNFTNNKATGDDARGGAVYFYKTGTVTNCNFVDNKATGDDACGGAVYFNSNGNVTNCNFADNTATYHGGAVYFNKNGEVTNCNFTGNTASINGGAVYFDETGTVSNCNFTNNKATGDESDGGAVYFDETGTVSNCNFTNNKATGDESDGGAVYFYGNGDVSNCNFTDNSASYGGAVYFDVTGTVTNCNFTANQATVDGGAVYFYNQGTVTNCNFADNSANRGGAIFSMRWFSTADTCIFKRNQGENVNVVIYPPTLNVDNFTTFYGSGEKLTFNLTTNRGIPVNNGNISISVYFKDGDWVANYSCLSGEGWAVSLPVSSYYANFTTEYAGFQAISRTITITIPNVMYSINVTSITTNNKTVNITAKSDIPKDILWDGKLLFILPNGENITANYAGNGTWWAQHTFDAYDVYQVNATYIGLDNVTINAGSISINKTPTNITVVNATVNLFVLDSVATGATLTPADAGNLTFTSSNSSVAKVQNGNIIAVGEGTATITVSFAGSDDYAVAENKTIEVAVSKIPTEIIINTTSLDLFVGDEAVIVANLTPADAGNATFTSSNESVVEFDDYGIVIAQGKGQAIITVSFAGNNKYAAAENRTITVTVSLNDASVTVDNNTLNLKAGETYAINATKHPDTIMLDITYTSSNSSVATVDEKGIVTAVGVGTAVITVEVGDDEIYAKNSTNVTVTVSKVPTEIGAKPVTATYNINKNLVITLKDANGNPVDGVSLSVDLNGAKTYTTDKNGQVKVSTKGLDPKTYTAKITFNGNAKYAKSSKNVKVTVKKATPKLTAKKKTFKTTTKTKKYTITLKDNTGKAINKAKVTLKVKGKTYKATTNSKGKAVFKIKNLKKKGTFKATVTYKGNKYYNKVSKKAKIKVIVTFKTVSKGSKDKATVKEIQQALKDHGYYLSYKGHYLKIDGIYKGCTERSVKEYQHDKGLKVTGKVDEKTARKLGLI